MKFIGREKELKRLNKFFSAEDQTAALLYGRRRVGKSAIIKQSLIESNIQYIYYECKETTESNNAEALSSLISEKFDLPQLRFAGVEAAIEFLFQKGQEAPFLLVLDEYPYLREVVVGLDSILQVLIDKYKDRSGLKIVLCGSFVKVMKELLKEDDPLYGRIDLAMQVSPMDYYDSAGFYPDFTNEDKVRLYSVFGGIPFYNKQIQADKTVEENLLDLIIEPGAILESEVVQYIRSEISKINNANEVFEALVRGYSRFSDILSQSHVSSSPTLVDVLEKLIRMEVVKKTAPINEENNKKKTSYSVSDNLTLFYYRYLFRYMSQRSIMDPKVFYDRYIATDLERQFVPKRFETICKQYLIRNNRKGRLDEVFDRIGKYSYDLPKEHRNGEFDIVTQDPSGYIFYEAKFRNSPITRAMIDTEIEQVKQTGLECYRYGFFSRKGFEGIGKDPDLILIDLKDLYEAQ